MHHQFEATYSFTHAYQVMSKIKDLDRWFNNLSGRGRVIVTIVFFALAIPIINLSVGIIKDVGNYFEASKYDISTQELFYAKKQAQENKMTLEGYFEEIKNSKKLGFPNVESYWEAKSFGVDNPKEFTAAKKLGRTKEEWIEDKKKIKSSGKSIDDYVTQVESEINAKKEEERIQAENKKRWNSEASACEVRVDRHLRDLGYVFQWDDLGWLGSKFDAYDMNNGGDYGRYVTNKVAFQNRMGGYIRQTIECQVSRGTGSVSFYIR